MTREQELAWAGGLFEGEGCFTYGTRSKEPLELNGKSYYKVTPKIKVSMIDKDVLERFAKIIGMGNVTGPYKHHNPNAKPLYEWSITSKRAIDAILLLKPFLLSRRLSKIEKVLSAYYDYQDIVIERKKHHMFGTKPGEPLRNLFKPKKLTIKDVNDIILRAKGDEYYASIAKDYEITPQYVGQLLNGKNKVTERFGPQAIKG